MNKFIIAGGLILVVIAVAFLLIPSRENGTIPPTFLSPPPAAPAESLSIETNMQEATVEITAQGFSPPQITITPGTIVRFVNKDSRGHWPASGVHPAHQLCPGFDSLRPLQPNETYSFTFRETKQCPMHDHLNPQLKGVIMVK